MYSEQIVFMLIIPNGRDEKIHLTKLDMSASLVHSVTVVFQVIIYLERINSIL